MVIQNGCLGGPTATRQEFYASGSDDFRAYIWEIPPSDQLKLSRQELREKDWNDLPHPELIGSLASSP